MWESHLLGTTSGLTLMGCIRNQTEQTRTSWQANKKFPFVAPLLVSDFQHPARLFHSLWIMIRTCQSNKIFPPTAASDPAALSQQWKANENTITFYSSIIEKIVIMMKFSANLGFAQ